MISRTMVRPGSTEDRYLTVQQLARYSGLSIATLRRRMRDAGLPYRRVGRRILVLKSAFDRWLAGPVP